MSKRDLKKYLHSLSKDQLEEQVLELYERFKEVKIYYDFAFNPREEKIMEEARFKISKEYFPVSKRRPKLRRSIAQKLIKHYIQLGLNPVLLADLMAYNIEIAQTYTAGKTITTISFYTSMFKSFEQLVEFTERHGLRADFSSRIEKICAESKHQNWMNHQAFDHLLDKVSTER